MPSGVQLFVIVKRHREKYLKDRNQDDYQLNATTLMSSRMQANVCIAWYYKYFFNFNANEDNDNILICDI